jgi:hypothetical protein
MGSQIMTFAQKNKEVVYINSMTENPGKLSFLSLELPIWHLWGSPLNSSLYDLKSSLSYVGSGKFNGGATLNLQLGDRIAPDTYERVDFVYQPMAMSQYETAPAKSFEVWGSYFFTDKLKPKKVPITVKRVGDTIYFTNVDAHQQKKIGWRFGYKQGFTWYNMNNTEMLVSQAETPTVTESISYSSMSTVQSYKILKAGLTFSKATNVKVQLEDYGERTSKSLTLTSFNVLFAVQNDFENLVVGKPNPSNNTIEFLNYNFSDENKRLPIGFEFNRKLYSKSIISYEYGIGYYPGLMKRVNIGVNFGVSINIDFLRKKNTL